MTVTDQRTTQNLLPAALTVLKGFYDEKVAAALMQSSSVLEMAIWATRSGVSPPSETDFRYILLFDVENCTYP